MGSQSLKETIKGGKWDNKCNQTGNVFNKWLTDQKLGRKTLTPGLISRGFASVSSKLTSQTADNVATEIQNILTHESPEALQNVLASLLLACPWHDSLLAHACLFLSTFCDQVQDDRENFQKYFSSSALEELKSVCSTVKSHLQPFIFGSSYLSAVCHHNGTLYSGLWNPEAIPLYVKWLKDNLDSIIQSLNLMSSEASSKWESDNLQTAKTAGPFRFGFVFKGSWSDGTFKNNLPSKISPLTNSGPGSLQSLQKSLENFSTGNPGATAGGVVTGLFGLGGAGAGVAYATNAFGLKDIITGLLSSFLK